MAENGSSSFLPDRAQARILLMVAAIVTAHLAMLFIFELPLLPLLLSSAVLSGLMILLGRDESGPLSLLPGPTEVVVETRDDRHIAAQVLSQFPVPVIVLGDEERIIISNEESQPLIAGATVGRRLSAVVRAPALLDAVNRILDGGEAERVEFVTPGNVESYFEAYCAPLNVEGSSPNTPHVLIALNDLTEAKRVDQMRVDFIANVSHELKTPLSSMVGFVETLRGIAKDDNEAREEFLSIMHKQAGRMGRLVDDLLSLSRIELNEHVAPTDLIALEDIVEEAVTFLRPVAEEANVQIEYDGEDDLPPVFGSRDQLFQVFQNLIDNAVKYGGSDNTVTVSVSLQRKFQEGDDDQTIRVDITDRGPGIEREHIPRLTERFYRVDVKQSRNSGGTGLGLAIVKHIVSRHKGEFSIQSVIGKGSTFTVMIPVADAEKEEPRAPRAAALR